MTRRRANAPAILVTGDRSATTTATAASTLCAIRRAAASATLAGTDEIAVLNVSVITRLVSSLQADVSVGKGFGVSAVSGTVSACKGSVTRQMDRVPVNPDTEESYAESRVQLGYTDRTAKTGVATVKASSPVR